MTVVADSGPLIHLAIVGQFLLLKRYFYPLLIIPQVYEEAPPRDKEGLETLSFVKPSGMDGS
jgi:hypothetical protein